MRLWLDDIRKPPFGYDKWVKTASECISELDTGKYTHVSLDHDLAEEHYTGYYSVAQTGFAVLDWMAATDSWCADISVHTMNGGAGDSMMSFLKNRAPNWVNFRRVRLICES